MTAERYAQERDGPEQKSCIGDTEAVWKDLTFPTNGPPQIALERMHLNAAMVGIWLRGRLKKKRDYVFKGKFYEDAWAAPWDYSRRLRGIYEFREGQIVFHTHRPSLASWNEVESRLRNLLEEVHTKNLRELETGLEHIRRTLERKRSSRSVSLAVLTASPYILLSGFVGLLVTFLLQGASDLSGVLLVSTLGIAALAIGCRWITREYDGHVASLQIYCDSVESMIEERFSNIRGVLQAYRDKLKPPWSQPWTMAFQDILKGVRKNNEDSNSSIAAGLRPDIGYKYPALGGKIDQTYSRTKDLCDSAEDFLARVITLMGEEGRQAANPGYTVYSTKFHELFLVCSGMIKTESDLGIQDTHCVIQELTSETPRRSKYYIISIDEEAVNHSSKAAKALKDVLLLQQETRGTIDHLFSRR